MIKINFKLKIYLGSVGCMVFIQEGKDQKIWVQPRGLSDLK